MTLILYIKKPFERTANNGRDPLNQNFRKFRSKTQWIGSVQPEKFRKNWSTFWGGPLFPVGPVGILVEWIAPVEHLTSETQKSLHHFESSSGSSCFCPSSNSLFGHLCFHPCPRLSSSPTYEHMRWPRKVSNILQTSVKFSKNPSGKTLQKTASYTRDKAQFQRFSYILSNGCSLGPDFGRNADWLL